jgi:hypothetical protein
MRQLQTTDLKEDCTMASVLALPDMPRIGQVSVGDTFDPDVDAFLERYPFLLPMLKEAVDPLMKIFGETTFLSVTVEADPEVDDWDYLVVAVLTTLPAEEAQAKLDTFGTTWWLEHLPRAQGKLLFTLEFV